MLWVNFLWFLLPLLTEYVQAADNYFGNNRNWNLRRPIALDSRPNPVVNPIHSVPKPLPKPIEVEPVRENKLEPAPVETTVTESSYDQPTVRPNYRLLPQRVPPRRPFRPEPEAIIATTELTTTEEPKSTSLYIIPPDVPMSDDIEVIRSPNPSLRHVLQPRPLPRTGRVELIEPALEEKITTTAAPSPSLPDVVIVEDASELNTDDSAKPETPLIVILPESQSTPSPTTELELIPIIEEPRIEILVEAPEEEPEPVQAEEFEFSPKIEEEKAKPKVAVVEKQEPTGPISGDGRGGRSPPLVPLIPIRRPDIGSGSKPYRVPKPVVLPQRPNIVVTQRPIVRPTPPIETEVKPGFKSIPLQNPGSEWTTQAPAQLYDYECKEADGFYGVAGNCDSYVECRKYIAVMLSCPDGLHYNPRARWPEYPCGYPSEVKCESNAIRQVPHPTKECPQQYGFYPMTDSDCSRYIMCEEGKAFVMNCPSGLVFNAAASSCDWPENVPSCKPDVFRGFTCPAPPLEEDGTPSDMIFKYRYRESCKEYIACQRGHPRLLRCDAGMSFDEDSEVCVDSDYVSNCSKY